MQTSLVSIINFTKCFLPRHHHSHVKQCKSTSRIRGWSAEPIKAPQYNTVRTPQINLFGEKVRCVYAVAKLKHVDFAQEVFTQGRMITIASKLKDVYWLCSI